MDSNAHSRLWSIAFTEDCGEKIESMMARFNLTLLNKGNVTTYRSSQGQTIIDLTLSDEITTKFINKWRVVNESTASDHQHIAF